MNLVVTEELVNLLEIGGILSEFPLYVAYVKPFDRVFSRSTYAFSVYDYFKLVLSKNISDNYKDYVYTYEIVIKINELG